MSSEASPRKLTQDPIHTSQTPLWVETLKNLLRNRNAVIGIIIIGFLVLVAVFADQIAPYDPIQSMIGLPGETGRLPAKPPCVTNSLPIFAYECDGPNHILGLDLNARDMFSRIVYGSRASLPVGVIAVGTAIIAGTFLGLIAGYGGTLESANETTTLAGREIPVQGRWRILWCIIAPPIAVWDRGQWARRIVISLLLGGVVAGIVNVGLLTAYVHPAVDGTYLSIALVIILLEGLAGIVLAIIVALLANYPDDLIMRIMDVMLAFPSLILVIAIVTIRGPGLENALFGIAIVSIPVYARLARSSVLSVKEQEFIVAERALGANPLRIVFRQILPNTLTPIIVQGTLGVGTAVLDAAALSFLGLGAQPPTPEWGQMLSEARNYVFTAPHLVFYPGIAIMITVLGFNLLGDGMRDALDPRLNRI